MILIRFFRIGSLEILTHHDEYPQLRQLLRFILRENFPRIWSEEGEEEEKEDGPGERALLAMFEQITEETARLMAAWMSVGFVHGVMNTDNFSLASVTIDYGPFGFVEEYDPHFVPNTSDDLGR